MSKLIKKITQTKPSNKTDWLQSSGLNNTLDLGLRSLEPRILLDAAVVATGAEVAADAMQADDAAQTMQDTFGGRPVQNDMMTEASSLLTALEALDETDKGLAVAPTQPVSERQTDAESGAISLDDIDTTLTYTTPLDGGAEKPFPIAGLEPVSNSDGNDTAKPDTFTDLQPIKGGFSFAGNDGSALSDWPLDVNFDPATDFSNNNDTLTTTVNGNVVTFTRTDSDVGSDGTLTLETGNVPNEIGLGRSLVAGAAVDDSTLGSSEDYVISFSEAASVVAIDFGFLNNNIDGAEELTGFVARDADGNIIADAVFRLVDNSPAGEGLSFRGQNVGTGFVSHDAAVNASVDIVGVDGAGGAATQATLEVTSATSDIASVEFSRTTTRIADVGQANNANNKGALGVLIGGIQFDPVEDASTLDTDGDGNDIPVANDDGDVTPIAITGNVPLNIDVLANDTYTDGDSLTITAILDPVNPSTAIPITVGDVVELASGTQIELLASGELRVTTTPLGLGLENFAYEVSDGNQASQANVTLERSQGSLFTVPSNVTGSEDNPIPIPITVDPALLSGGGLPDTIGTAIGFRDAADGTTPSLFTIPPNVTSITITASGGFENSINRGFEEEFISSVITVDLTSGTFSGHDFVNYGFGQRAGDNFAFSDVPLGDAASTGLVAGERAQNLNDFTVDVVNGQLSIVSTNPLLDIVYLVEFQTSDGSSTNLLDIFGAVQTPTETTSTFNVGTDAELAVINIQGGRDSTDFRDEDKVASRLIVDYDTGLVSGTIFSQTGRGANNVVAFAFEGYDLNSGLSILDPNSGATILGDTAGFQVNLHDFIITQTGDDLTITRPSAAGAPFELLFSVETYDRIDAGSAAFTLGSEAVSFTHIQNENLTTTFEFPVAQGAETANVTFALSVAGNPSSTNDNENTGTARIIVDFENGTTSGTFITTRADSPDLLTWTNVPFGTRLFDHPDTQSNHDNIADFTDQFSAVLQFDLVTNPDGSVVLQGTAQVEPGAPIGSAANYAVVGQAVFSGRLPIEISGFAEGGQFNVGSLNPETGNWEVNAEDLANLAFIPNEHFSGDTQALIFDYRGQSQTVNVDVIRVADAPTLATTDFAGTENTDIAITNAVIADLVDQDGSETLTVELDNIPVGHTLTDGVNSFTASAGNQSVDITNWDVSTLNYIAATGEFGEYVIDVRASTSDIDGFTPTADTAETLGSFTVTVEVDTDGDGVADVDDIDDDNDGILDVIEDANTASTQETVVLFNFDENDPANATDADQGFTAFASFGGRDAILVHSVTGDDGDGRNNGNGTERPNNSRFNQIAERAAPGVPLDSTFLEPDFTRTFGARTITANGLAEGIFTIDAPNGVPSLDGNGFIGGFDRLNNPTDIISPNLQTALSVEQLTAFELGRFFTFDHLNFSADERGGNNFNSRGVVLTLIGNGMTVSALVETDLNLAASGAFQTISVQLTGEAFGVTDAELTAILDNIQQFTIRAELIGAASSTDVLNSTQLGDDVGEAIDRIERFAIDNIRITSDADGDGIRNSLDIDSDNDGITDNIEAQTTNDFIAPSGAGANITDANMDGLDDNFDARSVNGVLDANTSAATEADVLINPVDSDGDGSEDFVDLDSDNDGDTDTAEAALGQFRATGLSTDMSDADGDGLFDVFDTQNGTDANDGFDVNESIATGAAALPDVDGDASAGMPLTADVDFRDAEVIDTDGDGVIDFIDIDDDNDGVLDVDEGFVTVESLGLSTTESTLSFISTNANIVDPRVAFNDVRRIADGNQSNASGLVFNGTLEPNTNTVFTLGLNVIEGDVIDTFELRASVRALNDLDVRAFDLIIRDLSGDVVFSASVPDTGPTGTAPAAVTGFSLTEGFYVVEFIPQTHGAGNATTSRSEFIAAEIAELSFVGVTNTGMQIQTPGERDTDSDGIADHLDIDSDNDGITDNIESQTTNGFIAPEREVTNVSAVVSSGDDARQLFFDHNGLGVDGHLLSQLQVNSVSDFITSVPNDGVNNGASSVRDLVYGAGLIVESAGDADSLTGLASSDLEAAIANDAFVELNFTATTANGDHTIASISTFGGVANYVGQVAIELNGTIIDIVTLDSNASNGFVVVPLDVSAASVLQDGENTVRWYFFGGASDTALLDSYSLNFASLDVDGGLDLNGDGLNDVYDIRDVMAGDAAATRAEARINPVDTDGDGDADFIDTNSDNEGANDTIEAGLGTDLATGLSNDMTDADGDGLFDVFDTQNGTSADDGFDVNESIATGAASLPDSDGDASGGVPLIADVDFRDALNITPPVAQDDAFTLNENPEGLEIGVITNGSLLADNGSGADSDVNGDTLSVTQINGIDITNGEQITLPSGALLTIRTDGTFDYDPNGAFDSIDTGETATESFTYTLSDGTTADANMATVTITISGDNDAPTIDLNGPDTPGSNFTGEFVEDSELQPLARLVSGDAIIQDDEDNITQVTIRSNLPSVNDGDAEFLRIDSAGIDLSIRLSDGQIVANTPLIFGNTTFLVEYNQSGDIVITNAAGGTFDTDDLEGFIRLLSYENIDQNNTPGERSFEFNIIDSSNVATATSTLTVARANDAPVPVINPATSNGTFIEVGSGAESVPVAVINPDTAASVAALTGDDVREAIANGASAADLGLISVADLLAQLNISDAEQAEFAIGVIFADETQGRFQYVRTGEGFDDHEFTDFQLGDPDNLDPTPVPDGQALLLAADTYIRFIAEPGFLESAALTFRISDLSVGTPSNPPSTIVDDSGGVAPTNTSSLSSAAFSINIAADTDGDGVINADDLDDDNDGILDVDEGISAVDFTPTSNLSTYTGTTSVGVDVTATFGLQPDIGALSTTQDRIDNDNFTFLTDVEALQDLNIFYLTNRIDQDFPTTFDLDFSGQNVSMVYLHVNSIDQFILNFTPPPGIEFEILSSVAATPQTGPNLAFGDATPNSTDMSLAAEMADGFGGGSADGTIRFVSTDGNPITNLSFLLTENPNRTGLSEGFQFAVEVAIDSDGDGLANHLDIDSDNDGITDTIEAQTTAGFIAPSGTGNPDNGGTFVDVNRDGLDDNFDAGLIAGGAANGVGLTPVNSDGADNADFIDTDSDNDGLLDIDENGLGVTFAAGDTDGDGLADVFEAAIDGNVNDGFVVTEGIDDLFDTPDGFLPDGGGDASIGTPTPLVNDFDFRDVNDIPLIDTPLGDQMVVDGSDVSFTPMISDPDGDDLSFTVAGLPAGLVIDPDTGEITGTVDGSASQGGPDGDGVYTVTITADDGEGGTITESFEITVTNPAPMAVDDMAAVDEDSLVSGNVITDASGTDSDPDGDTLIVSEVGGDAANIGEAVAGSNGGLFTINADGSYSFDPNGGFDGLDVGESAVTTITYQISDGEGGFDTATLTVTVMGANDGPVVVDPETGMAPTTPEIIPAQTGLDGAPAEPLDISPFFEDVDDEPLTFTATGLPAGLMIDPETGIITGTPDGSASQGGPDGDGVYTVTITATDPDGEMVSTTVTYNITNPAPVAENDVLSINEDGTGVINLIDNDNDPDGDALVIDMAALPDGTLLPIGEAISLPQGVLTINPDGSVEFIAAPDFNGEFTLGYTVSDGQGGTDVATLTITVAPVNDAPILDLNESEDGFDATISTANNDPFIALIPEVDITDIDSETLISAGLSGTIAGLVDGGDEVVTLGGQDLGLGTGGASFDVMIGETTFTVISDGETFTITVSDGLGNIADFEALLTTLSYQNVADNPTLGERSLTLSVTDDGGLNSNLAELTFSVTPDVTPPAPPTIDAVFNPLTGFVDVTGTGEPGATITLTFPTGEVVTTIVDADGNYSASSLTSQPDGDVIAQQTDIAGNPSGDAVDDFDNTGDPFVDRVPEEQVIADAARLASERSVIPAFIGDDGIEDDLINLRRYFDDRLNAGDDLFMPSLEDASFQGSVSYAPVGRSGDNTDFLIVETVNFEHHINVQLTSTFDYVDDVNVQSWSVSSMNGGSLPAWVDHAAGLDFAVIQRPLDEAFIQLRVKALLDNGMTATTHVQINLETGQLTRLGDATVQAQTLSEQLALETQALGHEGREVLLALAAE